MPFERSEDKMEFQRRWFPMRTPSMGAGLNSMSSYMAVLPSAFRRAASRSYRCPQMMPRLCYVASGDIPT
jgi:hypothetical protein